MWILWNLKICQNAPNQEQDDLVLYQANKLSVEKKIPTYANLALRC
jgi:hypothetical protein